MAKRELRPSTIPGYEIAVEKHLVPRLGNLPLAKLAPRHLNAMYGESRAPGGTRQRRVFVRLLAQSRSPSGRASRGLRASLANPVQIRRLRGPSPEGLGDPRLLLGNDLDGRSLAGDARQYPDPVVGDADAAVRAGAPERVAEARSGAPVDRDGSRAAAEVDQGR